MNVTVRKVGSVVILDLDGRLTIEADTRNLYKAVGTLKELVPKHIVLNMERVGSMDCWGVGQIAVCYRMVRQDGGMLKLLKLGRRPRQLLERVKILSIIEAYESEEEAVRSFNGALKDDSQRQESQTVHPRPDGFFLNRQAEGRP
jgi:anti-anti-sigma factor